jgi:hypothetical protein
MVIVAKDHQPLPFPSGVKEERMEAKKDYKIEFCMCGHPELIPTQWNQPKPEPCQTIGSCPTHDYTCPICGFGVGCVPPCNCEERRF